MVSDIEHYVSVASRLGNSSLDLQDLYLPFLRRVEEWTSTDWFVPSALLEIEKALESLADVVPVHCRENAKQIFIQKNGERAGLWRDVGMVGALIELHAKLARLSVNSRDEDAITDLFNYAVIGLMSIERQLIRVGNKDRGKAFVTGDRQGLGASIREILQINGYVCYDYGVRITLQEIKAFFDKYQHIRFDYVVNNYGINHLNWLGEIEEADYKILDVNVKNPIMVVNELVRRVMGPCRILNISSQTYRIPQRCTAIYCASKAALVQTTKVMARELAPKGYVVNGLAPGKMIDTQMAKLTDQQVLQLRDWSEEQAEHYALSLIPAGRFTTVEEMALTAVKILALPEYVNGCIIDATGGV